MIKKKYRKGQIIFFETILVLCIYLFLFGFLLDGMQLFYTKMAMSMASYTGARTALAYETSLEELKGGSDYNYAGSNRLPGRYRSEEGEKEAQEFYNSIALRKGKDNLTVTIIDPDNDSTADRNAFFVCETKCAVRYMFPLISPTFVFDGKPLAQGVNLTQNFYMTRERVYD